MKRLMLVVLLGSFSSAALAGGGNPGNDYSDYVVEARYEKRCIVFGGVYSGTPRECWIQRVEKSLPYCTDAQVKEFYAKGRPLKYPCSMYPLDDDGNLPHYP